MEKDSSAPVSVPEPEKKEDAEKVPGREALSEGEEQMAGILSAEQVKGYQTDAGRIPVTFDVDTQVIVNSPNICAVVLPGEPEDGENHIKCAIVSHSDTRLSEDGKRLTVYLDKDGDLPVMVFNEKEEKIREYRQKNEEIAAVCLKQQREQSLQGVMPGLGKSEELPKPVPGNVGIGKEVPVKPAPGKVVK